MKIGTRVRTLYQHSETGVVVKPPKSALPLPGSDWNVIKFDSDGKCVCVRDDMLAASNQ